MRAEKADQNFRVVVPGKQDAKRLGLKRGASVLGVKRRIHFPNARDAVFSELLCRTDRLVFSQTLRTPGVDGGQFDA